ncbi:MAG TPA: aminoglycoside 6-adenylyltransferase [Chthonomonadaceae bacterium]|nr:aminoglycoside 6-adenylyltransferase [Chthonomonadaceae bacterium]
MNAILPDEASVLARLMAWGQGRPEIRAMILTSSRTRPDGPVDLLSDYDVILAVTDAGRFAQEDAWVQDYGPPMVRWGDQSTLYGRTTYFRGVVYADYIKIDYSIWPEDLLEQVAAQSGLPDQLDVGYRVLLDKEGRTAAWKPPTYRAHIPARPTEAEYRALVEEFWWETTYVAKSLWRDELMFARYSLDCVIKLDLMRQMLEWRIELDHDWSFKPGVNGRGLKPQLPADIWAEFVSGYVGPEIEANWAALFRTTALFRRVAMEVGAALGYAYPQTVDDQVSAYLNAVRNMPPGSGPPVAEGPNHIGGFSCLA